MKVGTGVSENATTEPAPRPTAKELVLLQPKSLPRLLHALQLLVASAISLRLARYRE
jgi:hypothetical protein